MSPRLLTALVALVLATLAAFAEVRDLGFVSYDDPGYVTANSRVQEGLTAENVWWAFTTDAMANWHPLTWLSHMTDVELFGLDPRGHHLTSLALHVLNVVLLFAFLHAATGRPWPSLAVAALFGLHPLRVESVAWVAERKDVLSTAFAFATLLAWLRWTRAPSTLRYLVVCVLFALGLMAKPMLVTLPCVLLLLDVWPLARRRSWRALVVEKVPLFALAAASSAITLLVQHGGGALRSTAELSIPNRFGNAVLAYAGYLANTAWPVDLACFYPIHLPLPLVRVAVSLLALLAITIVVLRTERRYLAVGWLWFLGMLVPVVGIAQVGPQAMADRYTYVPLVGVFIMVAFRVADLVAKHPRLAPGVAMATALVLAACIVQTRVQVSYWRDSRTLFTHALAVTRDNHIAHANLAAVLAEAGEEEAAVAHWREALRIASNFVEVHMVLGARAREAGRFDEAATHFESAVRHGPRRADTHGELGLALADLGRDAEAESHDREAIRLDPTVVGPRVNLAAVLRRTDRPEDARLVLAEALALAPENADVHYMLANTLAQLDRLDEAAGHYRQALALRPRYVEAVNNLGLVLARTGKLDDAIARFTEALEIDPAFAPAYANRGKAFELRGDPARARADRERAVALEARSVTP